MLDELVKKGEAVKHDLGNRRFAYTGTASPAAPGATGTASPAASGATGIADAEVS